MSEKRYTIAVDFDGVIHSYTTPWVSEDVIPDPPVPGAVAWLRDISRKFDVVIFTTRAHSEAGVAAVRQALTDWGVTEAVGWEITYEKVPALVYVDDRGYRFTGDNFPTADQIHRELVPWNRVGVSA